jgi:hypothetical protein
MTTAQAALELATESPLTVTAHGKTFTLTRLAGSGEETWHLRDHAVKTRSRFGSREEMIEDVQYALYYGVLPVAAARW